MISVLIIVVISDMAGCFCNYSFYPCTISGMTLVTSGHGSNHMISSRVTSLVRGLEVCMNLPAHEYVYMYIKYTCTYTYNIYI